MSGSRLRFVLIGLVLGVLIAVAVASQGCGGDKHHVHAAAMVAARAGRR